MDLRWHSLRGDRTGPRSWRRRAALALLTCGALALAAPPAAAQTPTFTVSIELTDTDGFREGGMGTAAQASFTVTIASSDPMVTTPADVRVPFELVDFSFNPANFFSSTFTTISPARIETPAVSTRSVLIIPAGQTSAPIILTATENTNNTGKLRGSVELMTPTTMMGTVVLSTNMSDTKDEFCRLDNDPTFFAVAQDMNAMGVVMNQNVTGVEGGSLSLRIRLTGAPALNSSVTIGYEIRGTGITVADLPVTPDPSLLPGRTPRTGRVFSLTDIPGGGGISGTIEFDFSFVASASRAMTRELVGKFPIADDMLFEGDETATFRIISVATGGGSGDYELNPMSPEAQLTIQDNDLRLSLGRTPPAGPVEEGDTVSFTVSREGPIAPAVTVQYSVTQGGATQNRPETILANARSATFDVVIPDDDVTESGETVEVALLSGTLPAGQTGTVVVPTVPTVPPSPPTRAQIVVAASDLPNVVLQRLSGPGGTVVPGGGSVAEGDTATYGVMLTGGMLNQPVEVTWRVEGSPGAVRSADAADFGGALPASPPGTPLRFTAAGARQEFSVPVGQDSAGEGDEEFQVKALTTAALTGVMSATLTTTLVDDDVVTVAVRAEQSIVPEGETATLIFTRSGPLDVPATVTYRVRGVDPTDFRDPLGGRIVLPANALSASLALAILVDGVVEGDETLEVVVDAVSIPGLSLGVASTQIATVTIPGLQFEIALSGQEVVEEGAVARFTVALSPTPAGQTTSSDVVLGYDLGGGGDSAVRGQDYTPPRDARDGAGELRIPAGQLRGVIEVPVLRDGLLEAEEVFSLALAPGPGRSSGGGGSLRVDPDRRRLQVRILDNADQEARREQRTRAMVATTHRAAAQMATDVISNRFGHRNVRAQSSAASADREVGAHGEAQPQAPTVFADCVQGKSGRGRCAQRAVGERSHTAREERAVSLRLHAGERWRKHKRSRAKSCSGRERTAKAFGRCAPAGSRSKRRPSSPTAFKAGRTEVGAHGEAQPQAPTVFADCVQGKSGRGRCAQRAVGERSHTARVERASPFASMQAYVGGSIGVAALQDPESAALLAGIDVPVRPFETDPYAVGGPGAPSTDASATDLGGLDPRLPSFAELLRGGHQFELSGEQAGLGSFGEGLSLWGAGTFQSLAGEPELGGRRLDYNGESFGVFLGADKRLALSGDGSELLAGAALGWTRGDLDYRDEALEVFELEGRFESKLWSIHPYASLRFSPRAQLWLIAGYGWGDAKIEERETREGERTATRRVETDATLWMVSAGAEGSVPLGSEASLLTARLQGTRTGGELDSARFGDGARLRGTRARTWRVAGELEVSHRFAFAEGGQFRPFATVRVRGDAGDDRQDDWEFAVDLGGGAELLWPERGLSLGLEGTAQLNQLQEYQEHRVTVDLSYDLAGDGRGLTVAVGSTLEGSGRLRDRIDGRSGLSAGSAFTTAPYAPPGAAPLGALLPGRAGRDDARGRELGALRHSLQGEIGYGLPVLPFWSPGLLTPYARFELAGRGASAYATGLRFEAATGARLGLELGVDLDRRSATPPPDYQFLLTGELDF